MLNEGNAAIVIGYLREAACRHKKTCKDANQAWGHLCWVYYSRMRRTPASALPASLLAACALIAFADSPPAFFENMAAGSGIDFVLQNSRNT